jgi:nucleotide-binding universal stress UspA family protein
MKTDKILIVADESEPSVKAIAYGFNLARDLSAKVILLSVVDPIDSLGNPDAGVFPDDALTASKTGTDSFLTKMQTAYGAGVETELLTIIGDIRPTIIKVAKQHAADLIVTGTHAHKGLRLLFKGSVSESIIHHSSVPVLVVPAT